MALLKTTKTALAKKLGVSRGSLYYKPKKPPLDLEDKNKIVAVMEEHPAYGARRIGWALHINRKKIKRLMQLHGLKPKIRRGFRLVKQGDLGRPETKVENILKVICPIIDAFQDAARRTEEKHGVRHLNLECCLIIHDSSA